MKLRFKRFDTDLPLPAYQTAGAVAFDLAARLDVSVEPGAFGYIPLNVAVEIPAGYLGLLGARSSTHKTGLMPANGVGLIDCDYRGNDDELILAVFNPTSAAVKIERGTRIAQFALVANLVAELEEVASLDSPNRGSFGTTGS